MMEIKFVLFDAIEKDDPSARRMEDADDFSFSKAAPADYADDDSSTASVTTTRSSLSSVTMSQCFSSWDSDESDEEEASASARLRSRCTASLPGRRCSKVVSSSSSTKSRYRNRQTISSSVQPVVTIASLEADIQTLIKRHGKDDPLVARTWNLIGNALFRNQEFRRALVAYKEAVLCGEPGVHLAEAYFNLGRVYFALGDMHESTDFLVRSLQTHEFFADTLGRDLRTSKKVAAVHLQLGVVALTRQGGGIGIAMASLERAREIYEHVDGCANELAQTLRVMDNIDLINNDTQSALFSPCGSYPLQHCNSSPSTRRLPFNDPLV